MPDADVSLTDVLDVDYPGAPEWSGDGRYLAATVYEDDGNALLVADADDDLRRWWVRPDDGFVTEFAWSPNGAECLVATDAGETLLADPDSESVRTLASSPEGESALTWANAGDRYAFYDDGAVCVRSLDGETRRFDAPERGPFLGETRMFAWRGDDARLAFRFVDDDTKQVGVLDVAAGDLIWRTDESDSAASDPVWLGDGRLLYDAVGEQATVRTFVAVDPDSGERETLFLETEPERGVVSNGSPRVAPDGTRFACCLPLDGWDHVHVFDADGGRTQLTAGDFEDKGDNDAVPRWLDDDRLVFASNRRDPGQRHVFAVRARGDDAGSVEALVETQGTNVHPRPSPDGSRLAYVHADRERSPELRVRDLEADPAEPGTSVTTAAVTDWAVDPVEPELITVETEDGWEVPGYLLDPRRTDAVDDDATDLPAVVWVHGGPMRQMRDGWHPGRAYGIAYTVQQYLAHRGYVGLCINYRGGIGYGTDFRQGIADDPGREMDDVVAGAAYLKDRPFVDEDAVGMWGLSYGGYAALWTLGTDPDAFAVGVNLAGVADRRVYEEWATRTKYPSVVSKLPLRFGGQPWEAPEEWDRGSPVTYMASYESPLYNFHGTADRYVNFEQLDVVVETLLETDADFEWEYFPGENHVFSKRATWRRTLERTVAAFERHL